MQIRELRAFVAIADAGRMDVAARHLGYSQPAISYQIKCLEREFQVRLFRRAPTGARLTREGEMILPSARAILAIVDSIKPGSGYGGAENPAVDGFEWANSKINMANKRFELSEGVEERAAATQ